MYMTLWQTAALIAVALAVYHRMTRTAYAVVTSFEV